MTVKRGCDLYGVDLILVCQAAFAESYSLKTNLLSQCHFLEMLMSGWNLCKGKYFVLVLFFLDLTCYRCEGGSPCA